MHLRVLVPPTFVTVAAWVGVVFASGCATAQSVPEGADSDSAHEFYLLDLENGESLGRWRYDPSPVLVTRDVALVRRGSHELEARSIDGTERLWTTRVRFERDIRDLPP